jgi:hypothetical protein
MSFIVWLEPVEEPWADPIVYRVDAANRRSAVKAAEDANPGFAVYNIRQVEESA